jgi:NitT/TauT family transport system substrate-binding protein
MSTDWLEKSGTHANWKLFASGPDIVSSFRNEGIDIGYIGLPPAIIGIDHGVPIACVAGGHVEGTVLIARRGYRTLEELGEVESVLRQFDGGIIGSPPAGSIHDVIIRNIINESGLDIKIRNYPWTDFVLEALVDGEIEAAVGTPPLAVASDRACRAKIVVPPCFLWPNNPSYGIVIRKELLDFPETILSFLTEHEKASNFIRQYPRDAAKLVSDLTGTVDEEFVIASYKISPKYCAALSSGFTRSTMAFVPVLQRLGYISSSLSREEIFYHDFIERIHRDPPHYDVV